MNEQEILGAFFLLINLNFVYIPLFDLKNKKVLFKFKYYFFNV